MIIDDKGFTLLEVLVAFIIMSLVLASLLEGGAAGMSNAEAANQTERAVSLAQSQLSGFDATYDHAAEDLQGDEGRYHWRLQAAPVQTIAVRPVGRSRPGPTTLYQVAITVSWSARGGRSAVRLETMRLTPVPPVPP